jgi:hypothetical protein
VAAATVLVATVAPALAPGALTAPASGAPALAPPPTPVAPTFEDIRELSGGSTGATHLVTGDLNGDGRTDVVSTGPNSTMTVLLALATKGTFADAMSVDAGGTPGARPALADVDGDGDLDLVIPLTTKWSVVRNNGDGTFAAATTYPQAMSHLDVGDVDGDGDVDVAGDVILGAPTYVMANDGTGAFTVGATLASGGTATALVDLDHDGDLDVAQTISIGHSFTTGTALKRFDNLGGMTFAASTYTEYTPAGGAPFALVAGDIDEDGIRDLVFRATGLTWIVPVKADGTLGTPITTSVIGGSTSATYDLTVTDLDGDGHLDLLGAIGAGNAAVAFGRGDFTFTPGHAYRTVGSTSGVAAMDLAGDASPDLVVTSTTTTTSVLTNTGARDFVAPQAMRPGWNNGAALADLNGDGRPDIVNSTVDVVLLNDGRGYPFSTNSSATSGNGGLALGRLRPGGAVDAVVTTNASNSLVVRPGNGDGTFATAVGYVAGTNPTSVALGDLNGDGVLDAAVTNTSSNAVNVLLGNGTGGFGAAQAFPGGPSPSGIKTVDLDLDGDLDLAMYNAGNAAYTTLANNGDGTFGAAFIHSVSATATRLAVGDVDEDGSPEIAVAVGSGTGASIEVQRSDAYGNFATMTTVPFGAGTPLPPSGTNPASLEVGDINGDGHLDLVTSSTGFSLGDGHGGFTVASRTTTAIAPATVRLADIDGDGRLDLVAWTPGTSDPVRILNTTPQAVTSGPVDQQVPVGDEVAFDVSVSGGPATFAWERSTDGGDTWDPIPGEDSATLRFVVSLGDDGNQYRAVVTQSTGSTTSDPATLTVLYAPTITQPPHDAHAAAGDPATFTATADARPTADAQWQRSDPGTDDWTDIDGATDPTYTLDPTTPADDGARYRVRFTNTVGTATSDPVSLTVGPPNDLPPTADDAGYRVTKGIAKTITLTGTDPEGAALTYTVTDSPDHGTIACTGATCTYTASTTTGTDTISFTATDPAGHTSAPATITFTITLPRVSIGDAQTIEPANLTGTSNDWVGVFVPVTLSAPLTTDVTVSYYTLDGTATGKVNGGDYRTWGTPSAPKNIKIPKGQTWAAIAPPIKPDADTEPDETFHVVIAAITAADGSTIPVGQADGTVTIVDNYGPTDDPAMTVLDANVVEGDLGTGSKVQFTILFNKPLTAPVTLQWRWVDGTATAGLAGSGADYKRSNTTSALLPAGTLMRTVDFAVLGDTVPEDLEDLTLEVLVPDGAHIVQHRPTGTMTITDDD